MKYLRFHARGSQAVGRGLLGHMSTLNYSWNGLAIMAAGGRVGSAVFVGDFFMMEIEIFRFVRVVKNCNPGIEKSFEVFYYIR